MRRGGLVMQHLLITPDLDAQRGTIDLYVHGRRMAVGMLFCQLGISGLAVDAEIDRYLRSGEIPSEAGPAESQWRCAAFP